MRMRMRMRLGCAFGLVAMCLFSCAKRKFGDQNSLTKQDENSSTISLSPLDLAFLFPFPKEGEKFVVKFSEAQHMGAVSKDEDGIKGELFPKHYFLNEVPQRWYENHAWLYDDELKEYAKDFDDLSKLTNDRLKSFTEENKKLIESLRNPDSGESKLKALKEKIWKDLYAVGIRLEPCFPSIPTSKQEKKLSSFPACAQHAFFMVGQVIVENRAYGAINILNFHNEEKIVQAMKDLYQLKLLSKKDTSGPIYVHPGFGGEENADVVDEKNVVAFRTGVTELLGNYFGSKTLFGGAFTSKEIRLEADAKVPASSVRKEIWNFAANASPWSIIFPGQVGMYPRTVDQLFYINTESDGSITTSVDLKPPTVGPLRPTFLGLIERPWLLEAAPANKDLLTLVSEKPNEKSPISNSHPGLRSSYTVDSIETVNIINENCAICHLPSAARYRHLPDSISAPIQYKLSKNDDRSKDLGSVESRMHPNILKLYAGQTAKQQWYLNMHGFAYGTNQPIVSARHTTEMMVISEIVSLQKIPK